MNRWWSVILGALLLLAPDSGFAQYNESAGVSAPVKQMKEVSRDDSGGEVVRSVETHVDSDSYGNASGNQYDLAVDGAFEGQTITVLQFYTDGGFDFEAPRKALAEKGFSVYRWSNQAPSAQELEEALSKSNQLWIISGDSQRLNAEHLAVIKKFFDAGHGLYIWGDNPPYVGDANFISSALFDTTMDATSYKEAQQSIGFQKKTGEVGFLPNHLLTTGIEHLYEGHTIPALQENQMLEPLIYGSDEILVAAFYDKDGKRAIVDTGFTRLYIQWDTAGTGRYVKNAAAWLANVERFGEEVAKPETRTPRTTEITKPNGGK